MTTELEHSFTGPRFTVGIEEELMIVDRESLDLASAIEQLLEDPPAGEIHKELLQSVLEIATPVCSSVGEAASELRGLRARMRDHAAAHGLLIGSSGTHPFARWEDQRIVRDDRYREIVTELGYVARQELVFGLHVHIGLAGTDEAIHVANGMRAHIPLLLALSANSPFWRGEQTGLASTRMPVFRSFPRVGIPPHYADWSDFEQRVALLVRSGVVADYTYLWYDVRPHPRLGTVEVRAMDTQTRVEHTVALAALIQCLAAELVEEHEAGRPNDDIVWSAELLDENRWIAARHGLDAQLVGLPDGRRRPVRRIAEEMLERLAPHAQRLGCTDELEGIREMIEKGNGAKRQALVYEANRDLEELMAEIVAATAP